RSKDGTHDGLTCQGGQRAVVTKGSEGPPGGLHLSPSYTLPGRQRIVQRTYHHTVACVAHLWNGIVGSLQAWYNHARVLQAFVCGGQTNGSSAGDHRPS